MKVKFYLKTRTGQLILLGVIIGVIVLVWTTLYVSQKNRKITQLKLTLLPDTGIYFTSKQEITNLVVSKIGNPIGKSYSAIDLPGLESYLKSFPFIGKAQAFAGLDGKLQLVVSQRQPILRVKNRANEQFFIDKEGIKIPYRGKFAPDVLVATGNIPEVLNDSDRVHTPLMKDLWAIAKHISQNPFWNAQFEQLHVDNYSEIYLIPRVGRHTIVLGNAENLPQKMENLRVFYDQALRSLGWDKYKVINLSYLNQVVGVKDFGAKEVKKQKTVQ